MATIAISVTISVMALAAACGSSKGSTAVPTTRSGGLSGATGTGTGTGATTAQPESTTTVAANATSCSVITQSEASAALGQTVRAPVTGKATVEGGVACVYYGPNIPVGADPDVALPDSVRVVLVTGSQASFYFNDYRSKVHAEAITGYGDQAFYDGGASLSVLKGDAYLRVAVGKTNNLSSEETLASDALPRM